MVLNHNELFFQAKIIKNAKLALNFQKFFYFLLHSMAYFHVSINLNQVLYNILKLCKKNYHQFQIKKFILLYFYDLIIIISPFLLAHGANNFILMQLAN